MTSQLSSFMTGSGLNRAHVAQNACMRLHFYLFLPVRNARLPNMCRCTSGNLTISWPPTHSPRNACGFPTKLVHEMFTKVGTPCVGCFAHSLAAMPHPTRQERPPSQECLRFLLRRGGLRTEEPQQLVPTRLAQGAPHAAGGALWPSRSNMLPARNLEHALILSRRRHHPFGRRPGLGSGRTAEPAAAALVSA